MPVQSGIPGRSGHMPARQCSTHRVDDGAAHAAGGTKHQHGILTGQLRFRRLGGRCRGAALLLRGGVANAGQGKQHGSPARHQGLGRRILEADGALAQSRAWGQGWEGQGGSGGSGGGGASNLSRSIPRPAAPAGEAMLQAMRMPRGGQRCGARGPGRTCTASSLSRELLVTCATLRLAGRLQRRKGLPARGCARSRAELVCNIALRCFQLLPVRCTSVHVLNWGNVGVAS